MIDMSQKIQRQHRIIVLGETAALVLVGQKHIQPRKNLKDIWVPAIVRIVIGIHGCRKSGLLCQPKKVRDARAKSLLKKIRREM